MHLFFYNILIAFYRIGIGLASLIDHKARKWIKGRRNIFENLKKDLDGSAPLTASGSAPLTSSGSTPLTASGKSPIAWFHCASLGEFEQGRPVMEEFRKRYPGFKILLTFFSPSGYDIRKNYPGADWVFYLPLDTAKNADKFIAIVRPSIALFVKYEFWYHYLYTLQSRNIPTFVFSAIFRDNQYFFKWYGKWFQPILKNITGIFVQDKSSITLLQTIGCTNAIYSGDTRFDRVVQVVRAQKHFPVVKAFVNGSKILVAGSTWPEDEYFLSNLINNSLPGGQNHELFSPLKFIIAPHEVEAHHLEKLENSLKTRSIRFSEAHEDNVKDHRILIIDSIGLLSHIYQYADMAYIGGGFGKGIHNILEAAAWGKPVLFGPAYKKFREAVELATSAGAFPVFDYRELENKIRFLLQNEMICQMSGILCKTYVKQNAGATEKIMEGILSYVNP